MSDGADTGRDRAAGYAGFRATIKAVATGPRGSRDLTFEEAREATAALLDGEVSPAQAGAFLIGMRVKGEAAGELAGVAQALRDRAPRCARPACRPPARRERGGVRRRRRAPAARARRVGLRGGGGRAGRDRVRRRGWARSTASRPPTCSPRSAGPARPSPAQSEAMLARAGVAVVHVGAAMPGWDALAALRDEIGLRGPVHSAEKLVDWFGARALRRRPHARRLRGRLLGALERLGAERAVAVRGIEGSDVVRPGRPVGGRPDGPARAARAARPPPARGSRPGDERRADPRGAGRRRRRRGPARRSSLSAAVRLVAAGAGPDASAALRRAEGALDDGGALAALDALVG